MTIVRKHFDPKLHAETDAIAKDKAIKLLKKAGFKGVENTNKHGVDLLVYSKDGKHVLFLECEIKRNWKTKTEFKYPDINFLQRKAKYCKLELPTIFLIFNEDLSDFLVIRDKDVLNSPLEEVRNKYCFSGEFFYKVPLKKASFSDLATPISKIVK